MEGPAVDTGRHFPATQGTHIPPAAVVVGMAGSVVAAGPADVTGRTALAVGVVGAATGSAGEAVRFAVVVAGAVVQPAAVEAAPQIVVAGLVGAAVQPAVVEAAAQMEAAPQIVVAGLVAFAPVVVAGCVPIDRYRPCDTCLCPATKNTACQTC